MIMKAVQMFMVREVNPNLDRRKLKGLGFKNAWVALIACIAVRGAKKRLGRVIKNSAKKCNESERKKRRRKRLEKRWMRKRKWQLRWHHLYH